MPQEKTIHWSLLFHQDDMPAWISHDGMFLKWQQSEGPPSPDMHIDSAWEVSEVMKPDFGGWGTEEAVRECQEMIRKWRSKSKPWRKLVDRVRTYQEKARG